MSRECNILVTRPRHQADNLCRLIEQQGWNAIRFPTLEIVAVEKNLIKLPFETIEQYQWLIFISVNAVNFALGTNDGKIEVFRNIAIAAVGKATEKALQTAGLPVQLVPETHFNTEGLLATKEMNQVKGKSCLIVRGKGGREILANSLRERGAKVDYLEVYTREKPVCSDLRVIDMLEQNKLDAITITSGDALKNLWVMVGEQLQDKLVTVPLIVISNRIKGLAEKYKFKCIAVTENPEDTAIIKTAIMSLGQVPETY